MIRMREVRPVCVCCGAYIEDDKCIKMDEDGTYACEWCAQDQLSGVKDLVFREFLEELVEECKTKTPVKWEEDTRINRLEDL